MRAIVGACEPAGADDVVRRDGEGRRSGLGEAIGEAEEEIAEIGSGLWATLARMADFLGDLTGVGPLVDRLGERFRDWLAGPG